MTKWGEGYRKSLDETMGDNERLNGVVGTLISSLGLIEAQTMSKHVNTESLVRRMKEIAREAKEYAEEELRR